jgi:hypothetical protein
MGVLYHAAAAKALPVAIVQFPFLVLLHAVMFRVFLAPPGYSHFQRCAYHISYCCSSVMCFALLPLSCVTLCVAVVSNVVKPAAPI